MLLNKLWLTSEWTHIKIEMPSKPLIYDKIEEHKRFLVACGALRGASLSTFEIFDVAKGQKRAFCSFDYWELSKDFLRYFQNSTWFYLPTTKDNLMGRVWGKTFLWCERPCSVRKILHPQREMFYFSVVFKMKKNICLIPVFFFMLLWINKLRVNNICFSLQLRLITQT